MGKITYAVLLGLIVAAAPPGLAYAQENPEKFCFSGPEAVELFRSRELAVLDPYQEGTGARVQNEYPKTSLFGQVKYVEGTKHVLCQYYNHVGLVFTLHYYWTEIDKAAECHLDACLSKPHWRTETVTGRSESGGPVQMPLDVCVIERDDLAYPSVGCPYFYPDWLQRGLNDLRSNLPKPEKE